MNPIELERLIDGDLRRLPAPRAPHTLLPRVLAAVQAWTNRPWYERTWFTWPLGWQMASAAALILIAILLPDAQAATAATASTLSAPVVSEISAVAERMALTVRAAAVVWRALFEPLLPYVFGLVALMSVACAAFGAALNHVALERMAQR